MFHNTNTHTHTHSIHSDRIDPSIRSSIGGQAQAGAGRESERASERGRMDVSSVAAALQAALAAGDTGKLQEGVQVRDQSCWCV